MDNGMSLSDIAAVTRDNDGFGGSNGAWWIIILACGATARCRTASPSPRRGCAAP